METNKYYIPTIEEFHVGFEYEVRNEIDKDEWSSYIFDKRFYQLYSYDDFKMSIDDEIPRNNIRVKYLDREDIEKCGFKCIQEEKKDDYSSYWCGFRNDYIEIFVQLHEKYFPRLLNIKSLGNNHIGNIKISIKNKSELKKLMKQLNIDGSK